MFFRSKINIDANPLNPKSQNHLVQKKKRKKKEAFSHLFYHHHHHLQMCVKSPCWAGCQRVVSSCSFGSFSMLGTSSWVSSLTKKLCPCLSIPFGLFFLDKLFVKNCQKKAWRWKHLGETWNTHVQAIVEIPTNIQTSKLDNLLFVQCTY